MGAEDHRRIDHVLGGLARSGGKRLAPMLSVLVPVLRRDHELDLSDAEAALLLPMSAATIDGRLVSERAKMTVRGRSHTKPGSLLKSQIPFPILGIDSDNGSEFTTRTCWSGLDQKIIFTRSRPGNKNDGAYVEQRTGPGPGAGRLLPV